jgi:hypothetical protein
MMARELKPCGTVGAYNRHRYRGEPTDDACRDAWRQYTNTRRRALAVLAQEQPEKYGELRRELAENRALTMLSLYFPDRYAELLEQERAA